jgi:hypothetical protein
MECQKKKKETRILEEGERYIYDNQVFYLAKSYNFKELIYEYAQKGELVIILIENIWIHNKKYELHSKEKEKNPNRTNKTPKRS